MTLEEVMFELQQLAKPRIKQLYLGRGVKEPVYGVPTGAMKPLAKKLMGDQEMAEKLYATGNYDAMYLAGVIADTDHMKPEDFDRWMEKAYCYMIGDFIVSVSLAETDYAQEVSDRWIASGKELYVSAGYSCYCWLIGNRKDHEFDPEKISDMLDVVARTIHEMPDRVRYAMNNFVMTASVSYLPLHQKAYDVAKRIGEVEIKDAKGKTVVLNAKEEIEVAIAKGRIGFKRRYVRC